MCCTHKKTTTFDWFCRSFHTQLCTVEGLVIVHRYWGWYIHLARRSQTKEFGRHHWFLVRWCWLLFMPNQLWLFVEEAIRLLKVPIIFVNQFVNAHLFLYSQRFLVVNYLSVLWCFLACSWLFLTLFSSVFRYLTGAAARLCGVVGGGPRSQ